MRLSCPTCQTEYDVPDAALTGRTRKVRCVNCGTLWEAGPIAVAAPIAVPAPDPAPTAAEIEYMQRPRAAAPSSMSYGGPDRAEETDFGRDFAPPVPVSRKVELPVRVDPAEARHQADRESFAALLEASRQPASQAAGAAVRNGKAPARKPPSPWVISVLILLLAVALIYLKRNYIMAAWPPSIRFFAELGLK